MKYLPVPLVYGTPQGRSATFSNAQGNQTAPYLASFFVYRVSNYQIATITNELIEATANDAASFVNESKLIVDTSIRNISNDIALSLFGNASGQRGQIASISTGVITLVSSGTVVNFEIGMALVSYDNSGNQSTGNAVGYIIAVDRTGGTVTVSATAGGSAGTPTNWSTTYLNLAVQGDFVSGSITAQTQYLKPTGLAGWLPSTAPQSGENFWGVDRSVDVTRLGGIRKLIADKKSSLIDMEARQGDMAQATAA